MPRVVDRPSRCTILRSNSLFSINFFSSLSLFVLFSVVSRAKTRRRRRPAATVFPFTDFSRFGSSGIGNDKVAQSGWYKNIFSRNRVDDETSLRYTKKIIIYFNSKQNCFTNEPGPIWVCSWHICLFDLMEMTCTIRDGWCWFVICSYPTSVLIITRTSKRHERRLSFRGIKTRRRMSNWIHPRLNLLSSFSLMFRAEGLNGGGKLEESHACSLLITTFIPSNVFFL